MRLFYISIIFTLIFTCESYADDRALEAAPMSAASLLSLVPQPVLENVTAVAAETAKAVVAGVLVRVINAVITQPIVPSLGTLTFQPLRDYALEVEPKPLLMPGDHEYIRNFPPQPVGTHVYFWPHKNGAIQIMTGALHRQYFFDFLDQQTQEVGDDLDWFDKDAKAIQAQLVRSFRKFASTYQTRFNKAVRTLSDLGCEAMKDKSTFEVACKDLPKLLLQTGRIMYESLRFEDIPNPALFREEDLHVLNHIEIVPLDRPLGGVGLIHFS